MACGFKSHLSHHSEKPSDVHKDKNRPARAGLFLVLVDSLIVRGVGLNEEINNSN